MLKFRTWKIESSQRAEKASGVEINLRVWRIWGVWAKRGKSEYIRIRIRKNWKARK